MTRLVLCFLAVSALGAQVIAADYPHRAIFNAHSRASGVGRGSLPLLQRQVGAGAATVSSELLGRFGSDLDGISTTGRYTTRQDAVGLQFRGDDGWTLRVGSDGTSGEYTNWPYRNAHLRELPVEQRPSLPNLETWGRAFIEKNLAGIAKLDSNEELVASHAMFENQTVAQEGVGQTKTSVVGAFIVFSRVISGTPVIGDGSKISIHFTVDGLPWGFSFDWPSYAVTTTTQRQLSLADIRTRQALLMPQMTAATREEDRFECGYFDVGARHRDPTALIQGGCFSQNIYTSVGEPGLNARNSENGLIHSGRLVVIPTGDTPSPDGKWRELGAVQRPLPEGPPNASKVKQK